MYLYLILIVIVLVIINSNNFKEYQINNYLDNFVSGTVAVVGNGPLSAQDRLNINNSDYVIRFNDLKNFRYGERCDIHAIRHHGVFDFASINKTPNYSYVMPIASNPNLVFNSRYLSGRTGVGPLFLFDPRENNILSSKDKVFKNSCRSEECIPSNSGFGVSSGTAVIDALENCNSVNKINIYGMNWNGEHEHLDFKYPDLVKKYCNKCKIYKTKSNNYLP